MIKKNLACECHISLMDKKKNLKERREETSVGEFY